MFKAKDMKEYANLSLDENQEDSMILDTKYISKLRFDVFSTRLLQIVPTKMLIISI